MQRILFSALSVMSLVVASTGTAQTDERAERWRDNCDRSWNNDRARFCEVRTLTVAPTGKVTVDGGANGGAAFYGSDRRDVKIVAKVEASADDDATARDVARQVRILTDGGQIRAEGPQMRNHTS